MRRWLVAAAGLFGLVAYVRRRRRPQAQPEGEPADELRAKLAESRAAPEPETPEVEDEPAPDAVGERREDVHDRARAAIDELS
jgi:broad specificity phosphatase PhoE